jgi:hypothetical protein
MSRRTRGEGEGEKEKEKAATRPKVLSDSTYATETAYASSATATLEAIQAAANPPSAWVFSRRISVSIAEKKSGAQARSSSRSSH